MLIFLLERKEKSVDARYLKQFRRKTGLNQKDFASVVGMSQSMVSQYERGIRKLSVDTFVTMKLL